MTERQDAFEAVYRAQRVRLVRVAFAMCGDRRIAEDAVADAVARAWPRFRDGQIDDAGPYLRRAVANEMIGRFRRRGTEESALRRHGTPDAVAGPDADAQVLWQAVLRLPMSQRAALVLRFLEDLSEADTAAALGISIGTVKSRTSRGLEALRRRLEEVDVNG